MKNWRDPKEYPVPAKTGMRRWAWEFLRRNLKYQADWERYEAALRTAAGNDSRLLAGVNYLINPTQAAWQSLDGGGKGAVANIIGELHEHDVMQMHEPPQLPGETGSAWMSRVEQGQMTPLDVELGRVYGLDHIANPAWDYAGMNVRWSHVALSVCRPTARWDKWDDPGWAVLAFDTRLPLKALLASAKWGITSAKERAVRNDVKPFPEKRDASRLFSMYLRVLDAGAASASKQDMIDVLCPLVGNSHPDFLARKNIDNWRRAAEILRDNDYRYLPLVLRQSDAPK